LRIFVILCHASGLGDDFASTVRRLLIVIFLSRKIIATSTCIYRAPPLYIYIFFSGKIIATPACIYRAPPRVPGAAIAAKGGSIAAAGAGCTAFSKVSRYSSTTLRLYHLTVIAVTDF
jgi:hypothetical protein